MGLSLNMSVFTCEDEDVKAAVVVCNPKLEVMCLRECTNNYEVCVWIKSDFGEMYVISVYCRCHEAEPYLTYLDSVREMAGGSCIDRI